LEERGILWLEQPAPSLEKNDRDSAMLVQTPSPQLTDETHELVPSQPTVFLQPDADNPPKIRNCDAGEVEIALEVGLLTLGSLRRP
jgi:hypothetical protein